MVVVGEWGSSSRGPVGAWCIWVRVGTVGGGRGGSGWGRSNVGAGLVGSDAAVIEGRGGGCLGQDEGMLQEGRGAWTLLGVADEAKFKEVDCVGGEVVGQRGRGRAAGNVE